MCVVEEGAEVPVFFDDQAFVAPLEQLPVHFSKLVVAIRKGRLQPLHAVDQVALRRAHDQMEVISHYAKPLKYPPALLAGFKQTFLKRSMGAVVDKQILAVVATIDDVINSILFLDS